MSKTKELAAQAVEQKVVRFYEDEIIAVRLSDNAVYIPLRPICEMLNINWSSQRKRIQRDEILREELQSVVVMTTDRGEREMVCLPLDLISGFLFGINPERVKPELRERVIRYRRECYRVLAEAFKEGRLTAEPDFTQLLKADSPAAQAYKMANAIMKMAQQQLLLEAQIETHSDILTDHKQRIEQIETSLGTPNRHITPDQAMQISQAVKAVAHELGKRSGRNEYGGVYGELYRQYSVNSYKTLPVNKFDDAIHWLNQWLQSLNDDVEF